ncbi:MAG: YbaN family protein [Chloroflexi bacterium]|nr:YbaN family protein [Chloroflexota bacterium]MBT3862730.1 YbaN family protein [Chloroflexota bacterium]MBT4943022.1 YbaN family protein [Chloroflexota bacterium]MBT5252653.1 YbaN family protein [Chloroflexota bacterium]MBT5477415.1 YbaN family protein [Chloroflexota bacterium]
MIRSVRKYLLYLSGLLFLGLGIAGYVLPGLPGTIFLIISASCFVRSNDRMYRWVTEHRIFGKLVKNYLETGSMPIRAKVISVLSMWVFTGVSLWVPEYGLLFKIPIISLAIIGTWYILSRKSSTDSTDDD